MKGDEDDSVNGPEHGKHYVLRDLKTRKSIDFPKIPGFERFHFRDPFGNRVQVVDLHDESLVWLLPYQEVQKAGIRFSD